MGWINSTAAAFWRAGHALASPFRASAANELREYATLEDMMAGEIGLRGAHTRAGVQVSLDRAMQCATVYSCVRVLSESVAQLPAVVYRRNDAPNGVRTRLPATDRPEYGLLHDRPNEWQSAFEWHELVTRHLNMRGNHYSLKVRGAGGRTVELLPLHPDRIQVEQDPRTLAITYRYARPDGRNFIYRRDEVLHIRGPGESGVVGLSPIKDHAREAIGLALATEEHGARFFGNGARPGTVLQTDAKIGPEARKAMREDWESMHQGPDNAHRTAILDQGLKAQVLSVSNEDAQFLETRKYQRTEICGIFRVPPHMVADLERATFSNIEHQSLDFVMHSLGPWLRRIEQAVNRDIFDNDPSLYLKFNASALLRGAAKERAEALQIQRRNGVINANEWRELEDLNPRQDGGGDEYIVEGNMAPQTDGMPEDQQ